MVGLIHLSHQLQSKITSTKITLKSFLRTELESRTTCPHCGGDAQSKYPVCQSCGNVLKAPSPSNLFDLRETFGEIFEGDDLLD